MNTGFSLMQSGLKLAISRSYSKLPSELVVFMDDQMVVCWHPEQPFPYECSKPLPAKKPEVDTVLKVGEKDVKEMFTKPKKEMLPIELAKITYTCKHRWYPRARDKKRVITPPDRPYL
ncbi:hypothetical protein QAD02_022540 [Eretmocerus hayati]|uniref:Uncharacterized protein n=1 Tax=Eretmocerus hayati TaxID=131215 RepID=A0ACC2PUX7_9HYME|nr:hypothetical protein QAD02_022540 [Eretmocerus hayati]